MGYSKNHSFQIDDHTMQNQAFNPFEFLSTPWGKLPLGAGTGAFNPTDIHEVDKRIQELKTVEQWLSLNLSLLKTTIQGLEVQRGPLAAIQAFSESIATAASPTGSAGSSTSTGDPNAMAAASAAAMAAAAPGMDQASQWWNAMQQQFGQMMTAAQAGTASMMATPAPTTKKSKAENEKGA